MAQNALTTTERTTLPTARDWGTMLSMAEVLVTSGLLPKHITKPAAAVAIIQKGTELGVPPMHALSNIFVVEGKPTCSAELMLALVYRDHGDNAIRILETDNNHCLIAYARQGWKEASTYSFTMQDAATAGVASKQTWKSYPAAMLRARCISAVARMAFPDTIAGMYTSEELGAEVDEDGTPVISRVVREDSEPAPLKARAEPPAIEEPGIAPMQLNTIWTLADKCFADEHEEKVYAHVAKHYPRAVDADGKPSLRALTRAEAAQMIGRLTQAASKVAAEQAEQTELAAV